VIRKFKLESSCEVPAHNLLMKAIHQLAPDNANGG